MKLSVFKRNAGKKSEAKQIRREGNIPGILYGQNQAGEPIYIKGEEFQAILRQLKNGRLATTVFELQEGSTKRKAVVKEVQYHVATYAIEHIDFILLSDDVPVSINVPIQILGAADCAGIKLGGFLRQAIRTLKVSCLPKHIPQEFTVDVRDMNITESKRLADIELPATVKPLAKMNEVAIVIAKKA